jgi:hypothetical protein
LLSLVRFCLICRNREVEDGRDAKSVGPARALAFLELYRSNLLSPGWPTREITMVEKPMKSYRKELWFETPGRRAFLNITTQVEAALKDSGVQEGLVLVNAMRITASVFINDDERGLHSDYEAWLERLAPQEPISAYLHNRTGEDNIRLNPSWREKSTSQGVLSSQ